jgi:hypothetical protein
VERALPVGEAERIVATVLADVARAFEQVPVPSGFPEIPAAGSP